MSSRNLLSPRGAFSSSRGSSRPTTISSPPQQPIGEQPNYMTVGTGSTSSSAAALTQMLEQDSELGTRNVVGGSAVERGDLAREWQEELALDCPTPPPGQEQRIYAGRFQAFNYNKNRTTLTRAINRTVKALCSLQEMNSRWPAHYPSISDPQPGNPTHTKSTAQYVKNEPLDTLLTPGQLNHAFISGSNEGESSKQAERTNLIQEPRLVTPQIAQEFFILKLDLKLGTLWQTELVHSLEKSSIASLLDSKINQSVRHLLALHKRIEDTSSKVLITGDLNAGKSTFCNALLRRKVLPEDQQPCTSIFCEVLDVRGNEGVEEVHAVHKEATYNRNDESTYDVYELDDLEHVVVDSVRYTQAKVYLQDIRPMDESLLNNGIVDIGIIDAPGLNKDSLKTTAIFARQEEIDVVVFVVSAENHFTLSAEEFIRNAASEKEYIFIVVNRFDNIRDKDRCQRLILSQVQTLSPHTFKESAELVHFVSSDSIPFSAGSCGSVGKPGDDDKGKGREREEGTPQDFQNLEECLRRFVLEKRARSKLAPAKTYLLNMLSDLSILATVNCEVAQSELDRVVVELADLEPVLEQSKKTRAEVSEEINNTIEQTAQSIYAFTHSELSLTISRLVEEDLGVPYPGLFGLPEYAKALQVAMLSQISKAVTLSEQHARDRTVQGISSITSLGLLHLGDEYNPLTFRADVMFKRQRDVLARNVNISINIWDFFAVHKPISNHDKVAGTGITMTAITLLGGQAVSGFRWTDSVLGAIKAMGLRNARALILPSLLLAAVGTAAFFLHQIPLSLPRRLKTKLTASLTELNFIHRNSERISSTARRVLRFPADELHVSLQQSVEKLAMKREVMGQVREESQVARKYFSNLVRESAELRNEVENMDLEYLGEI